MRVLTAAILLFCFAPTAAFSLTNGKLFEYCKPYADRAFKLQNVTDQVCDTYVVATAMYASRMCFDVGRNNSEAMKLFAGDKDMDMTKIRAIIQTYVNEMAKNKSKWDYEASNESSKAITKTAPCK